jgi:uncharacterized protein involved in tellurium resistance
MPAQNVDLVLVIDASSSMKPCFDALRENLARVVAPLQGFVTNVQFCVLAQSVGMRGRMLVHDHRFIGTSGADALDAMYAGPANQGAGRGPFFTADAGRVRSFLADLKPEGNEDLLLALDLAADLPFGPITSTCRVIALFSDEPIEAGAVESGRVELIPELIEKLTRRRIKLFAALPESDASLALSQANGSELEFVSGGDGLRSVDFSQLLSQMGKSISVMSLQSSGEPSYTRALFGQDKWDASGSVSDSERSTVLAVGESAKFGSSTPLTDVGVQLRWTRAIDLDLHAFYRRRDGSQGWVYFGERQHQDISLDHDAGIGDRGGDNMENIKVDRLDSFSTIVFATMIFGSGDRYSDYDGQVEVTASDGSQIVVPLSAQQRGKWCAIARIDMDQGGASVSNLNVVSDETPSI